MTISRMQQPRQQYGLGSFVKKIGKKLKKVVKSPLGKAAIGAAIFGGMGGMKGLGSFFGKGSFNPLKAITAGTSDGFVPGLSKFGKLASKFGLAKGGGELTGKGLAALGIGGASLLAGMGAPKEGEDGLSDSGDRREGLENYLRYYYSNLNPNAKQSDIDEFVRVNMYADGGRVNYREGTAVPGGGGGTIMPVTLPDFATPGETGEFIEPPKNSPGFSGPVPLPERPITELPGGGGGTTIPLPGPNRPERPMPEQSEGDKLYQDVLDYLKSDSNQIESKEPEAMPMPFDPLKNMLETERDSSLQILKERGFDTDKMKFMEGDYGLLEAVKASGEVDAAKELFNKGFLDKQYSFQDLYGNMDLIDKVKNLYMDKIFMPSYSGYATAGNGLGSGYANDVGITNLPENKEEEERRLGGINYESKLKQRLADGGRIGYASGGKTFTDYLKNLGMDIEALDIDSLLIMQRAFERDEGEPVMSDREESAYGGRMGYNEGTPEMGMMASAPDLTDSINELALELFGKPIELLTPEEMDLLRDEAERLSTKYMANGGMIRTGFAMGSKPEQNAIQAAGIEGLMLNQNPAGVTELDLRETGGFIPPVGAKEKADDIPAMLANNEFVFTADAVRGMGDGDVNEGAQRMYDMMKKLEKGGRV
jgi:hypothetical protein